MDLTALYTFIDDFFKELKIFELWNKLQPLWKGSRGPQRKLSLSEVVTLNIFRFHYRIADLKTFHKLIKQEYSEDFPHIPNYENFLKATNKSSVFTLIILRYFLYVNRIKSCGQNHFIDSTPLPVCHNHNIYSHKLNRGIAQRGKSTKGWFYGFKLHGVCNEKGEFESLLFTPGNVHDSKTLENLVSDLCGTITADAGYLVKEDVFERIYTKYRKLYIATRKNMKRLMTRQQGTLFKACNCIETVWGVLKERFGLIFHLARSPHGLFRHYFYSLVSYTLSNNEYLLLKKP